MFSKLIVLLSAVVQLSLAQAEVPGVLVRSPYSVIGYGSPKFPTDCDAGYYSTCDSCTSFMVCIGGIKAETVACSGDKPFCSNGFCVATQDYGACPVNSIACTSEGFFPDPKACTFYHYCEDGSNESSVYECPETNVYNAETHLCKPKKLTSDCVTVTCDKSKVFQRYGTSKTYFAYCVSNTDIIMMKCGEYSTFDGTSCVFQCPKVGFFAHQNKDQYVECYYSGTKLVSAVRDCPSGKEFSVAKSICVTPTA